MSGFGFTSGGKIGMRGFIDRLYKDIDLAVLDTLNEIGRKHILKRAIDIMSVLLKCPNKGQL